ncbi:hypothetical protein [Sphingomonas sp. 35-24ZXX]|uniref:hypothetical protein n=1 Tax=Sphingomonas sp. 35-24ZXX TaxID=1545915 RepID=UPI0012E076AA|nr:hypothetical protein [Sphingomonas sp. 35-24ZXX]
MTNTRTRHCLRLSSIGLLLLAPLPAIAQSSSTSRIDAAASFEDAALPPIDLKIERELSFGRVTIPNNLDPNTTCIYRVTPRGLVPGGRVITEINSTSNNDPTGKGGCRFVTPATAASVQITCQPSLIVKYQIAITNAGLSGAEFLRASSGISFTSNLTNENSIELGGSGSSNGTFVCALDPEKGHSIIEFGGLLRVTNNGEKLPRGSNVKVGTIQFDVTY